MRPFRHPLTRAIRGLLVALPGLAVLAPAAGAQSIWLDRTERRNVHLELAKPMFEGDSDGFLTFAGWWTARLPLGERLAFVGELPLATLAFESDSPFVEDETSTMIGNPYVGIETRPSGPTGGWVELGIRAPLASDDELGAMIVGLAADTERWEAFVPDAVVVRAAAHWRDDPRVGSVGGDIRVAPALWISDDFDDDVEVYTTYGAQLLFHAEDARAGVGLSGRWLLSSGGSDFSETSTHQFELMADFLRGAVRPGITVRVPLDDEGSFNSQVDAVVGVTLSFVPD